MSPVKLTTEEFMSRAKEVHGNKYDYSEAVYTGALEKIKIICPEHGAWMQLASSHMGGSGCTKCGRLLTIKAHSSDTDTFIKKAKVIHGTKYDYSKVCYKNNRTKVKIICSKHGEFVQAPGKHLDGNGCTKCGRLLTIKAHSSDTDTFIKKAKNVHGNSFDYSKVQYVNGTTKVTIICSKHGDFNQVPSSHLMGAGCKKCATEIPSNKLDTDKFIKRSIEIHGDRLDYSETVYADMKSNVTLICPIHGKFKTNAQNHFVSITSGGCKKCKYESSSKKLSLTTDEFIKKAKEVWGNKWNYNHVNYVNGFTKVCIECKKHGKFLQNPFSHLGGNGCSKCHYKKEGRIAEYLTNKLIFHREYRIKNKRFDFYLPEFNFIIERDGEQHYGTKTFANLTGLDINTYNQEMQKNDKLKTKLAKDAGFKIARMPYWLTKEEEEIEIENILAGKPTYPDVPDLKQEKTKPKPVKNF